MPDKNDHLQIVNKNFDFLDHTEKAIPPFEEWGATILFYIAIHYLEAYLDECYGLHPRTHYKRLMILRNNTSMPSNIIRAYLTLYNRSRECRYQNIRLNNSDYQLLKTNTLDKIISFCQNFV
ncbi:MAG: hypothetical protein GF308_03105 [Candidatus Heimdallarchaeota archaeon]|nr:hypothetical protein [Candidatus Heimdallarchaeota archaeon]